LKGRRWFSGRGGRRYQYFDQLYERYRIGAHLSGEWVTLRSVTSFKVQTFDAKKAFTKTGSNRSKRFPDKPSKVQAKEPIGTFWENRYHATGHKTFPVQRASSKQAVSL
jgi:hypothetical protein